MPWKMCPDSGAQMFIGVSGLGVSAESHNDYGYWGNGVEIRNNHGACFVDQYGATGGACIGYSLLTEHLLSAGVLEELKRVQRSFFYSISLSHFMMKNDRKMNGMFLFHCLLLSQVANMTGEIGKWFFTAIYKLFIPFPSHSCYIQQV